MLKTKITLHTHTQTRHGASIFALASFYIQYIQYRYQVYAKTFYSISVCCHRRLLPFVIHLHRTANAQDIQIPNIYLRCRAADSMRTLYSTHHPATAFMQCPQSLYILRIIFFYLILEYSLRLHDILRHSVKMQYLNVVNICHSLIICLVRIFKVFIIQCIYHCMSSSNMQFPRLSRLEQQNSKFSFIYRMNIELFGLH